MRHWCDSLCFIVWHSSDFHFTFFLSKCRFGRPICAAIPSDHNNIRLSWGDGPLQLLSLVYLATTQSPCLRVRHLYLILLRHLLTKTQDLVERQFADFFPPTDTCWEKAAPSTLPCVKQLQRRDFLHFAFHVLDELSAWCVPFSSSHFSVSDMQTMLSEISRITGVPARSISAERSKVGAFSLLRYSGTHTQVALLVGQCCTQTHTTDLDTISIRDIAAVRFFFLSSTAPFCYH